MFSTVASCLVLHSQNTLQDAGHANSKGLSFFPRPNYQEHDAMNVLNERHNHVVHTRSKHNWIDTLLETP